jgi:hypothetical protein
MSFSLQRRWSGAAGVLWFGAGGGRRRSSGFVAGAFTKRNRIPRNMPRVHVGKAGRLREATA